MALYNTFLYNEEQFNAFYLAEQILLIEAAIAVVFSLSLADTIFSNELFTKQIINKGLSDTIKTADWFSPKRIAVNTEWFD